MKNLVLLVESLMVNKAIKKMSEFINKDPECNKLKKDIEDFQANFFGSRTYYHSFSVNQYSLDAERYVISMTMPKPSYFKFQSKEDEYLEQLEAITYPFMSKIEEYFSDLGFEDSYQGMRKGPDQQSEGYQHRHQFVEFVFDLMKEKATIDEHEVYQTLYDFGNSSVLSNLGNIKSIFDKACMGRAKCDISFGLKENRGEMSFYVSFSLMCANGVNPSDITAMSINLPSDIDGHLTIGSGFVDIIEAIMDKHGNKDLSRLPYKITSIIHKKTNTLTVYFTFDANKLFKLLSDKYGR